MDEVKVSGLKIMELKIEGGLHLVYPNYHSTFNIKSRKRLPMLYNKNKVIQQIDNDHIAFIFPRIICSRKWYQIHSGGVTGKKRRPQLKFTVQYT